MKRESVFITGDMREADRVEHLLEKAEIDYTMRLDAIEREGSACSQGILYEVAADDAEKCRRLILESGLAPVPRAPQMKAGATPHES